MEVKFWKIQDGGLSPFLISILDHNDNFGVDQHFCTKFCIQMENQQPKDVTNQIFENP